MLGGNPAEKQVPPGSGNLAWQASDAALLEVEHRVAHYFEGRGAKSIACAAARGERPTLNGGPVVLPVAQPDGELQVKATLSESFDAGAADCCYLPPQQVVCMADDFRPAR